MDITKYTFFQQLTQLPFIGEIWLYGSRARSDHKERSDIDLAIIGSNITPQDWQEMRSIVSEPDTLLKIDCVRFDTLKDEKFKKNILRDKKVLFKRSASVLRQDYGGQVREQDVKNSGGQRKFTMQQNIDELLISAPKKGIEKTAQKIQEILEGIVAWVIPLKVTAQWGENWKEVSK